MNREIAQSNNQGKPLPAMPYSPRAKSKSHNTPILVATMLHQKEITATIRGGLQLRNPIITLDP